MKFNFFGIYTLSGFNFSTRTVKVLERLPDEYAAVREALIKARDVELVQRDGDHTARLSYWLAMPDLIQITGLQGPALSNYMLRLNLLLIKKAPLEYLEEVFASFSSYWLPSVTQLANRGSLSLQILWAIVQLGAVAVFALAVCRYLWRHSFQLFATAAIAQIRIQNVHSKYLSGVYSPISLRARLYFTVPFSLPSSRSETLDIAFRPSRCWFSCVF